MVQFLCRPLAAMVAARSVNALRPFVPVEVDAAMSDDVPAANSAVAGPGWARGPSPQPVMARLRSWSREPAGVWVIAALAVLVLAAPAWLMADDFRSFRAE